MIKTSSKKTKRVIAINGKHTANGVAIKSKINILDFAGAWNELPNEKLKVLDTTLSNRRKSATRRTSL